MPLGPVLSPEEQRRQAVEDAIKKLYDPDTSAVDEARSNAGIQNLIASIGQAAEGYVRAPAIARGGPGTNPVVYDAIRRSAQGDVDAAQAKQDAVKQAIMSEMTLRNQLSDDERKGRQEAEVGRHNKEEERLRGRELDIKDKERQPKPMSDLDKAQAEHLRVQTEAIRNPTPKPEKPTMTQESYEKESGTDLANWKNQGGSEAADATINKLKTLANTLEKSKEGDISGGMAARLAPLAGGYGETVRDVANPNSKAFKQAVASTALPGMKVLFPGTTSDRELRTFLELSFDSALHPIENARKLREQIHLLEVRRNALQTMEKSFKQSGRTYTPDNQRATSGAPTSVYPKTVTNAAGATTTVENAKEEQEAAAEGFK